MAMLKCVRCGRSVEAAQVPSDGQIVCACGYRISVPRGHTPADTMGTTSKPPNVAKAVLIGLAIAVMAAIPIGHSLHQAWVQNTPSDKTRAVAASQARTVTQAVPPPDIAVLGSRRSAPPAGSAAPEAVAQGTATTQNADAAKPDVSVSKALEVKQRELWERGVLVWVGKPFSLPALATEYGEGQYTSLTDNEKGWVWFKDANVTFRFNKRTMLIEQAFRGQYGKT